MHSWHTHRMNQVRAAYGDSSSSKCAHNVTGICKEKETISIYSIINKVHALYVATAFKLHKNSSQLEGSSRTTCALGKNRRDISAWNLTRPSPRQQLKDGFQLMKHQDVRARQLTFCIINRDICHSEKMLNWRQNTKNTRSSLSLREVIL